MSFDRIFARSRGSQSWFAAVLTLSAACALPELRVAERAPDADQTSRNAGSDGGATRDTHADSETRSRDAGVNMSSETSVAATPGASSGQAGDASTPATLGGSGANGGGGGPSASPHATKQLSALGATCVHGSDCSSMACVDGVCCASASCATCQRCGAGGQCHAVLNGNVDNCNKGTCNSEGRCVLDLAENCSSTTDCNSNQCSNGVCCSTECSGVCSGCDVQPHPGSCGPVGDVDNPGKCDGNRTCFSGNCVDVDLNIITSAASPRSFGDHLAAAIPPKIAQVITIQKAGTLLEVRMNLQCDPRQIPKLLASVVRLDANGAPSDAEIALLETHPRPQRTRTTAVGTDFTSFTAQQLSVAAGDKFAIVVDGSNVSGGCGVSVATGNVYAGGELWEYMSAGGWRADAASDYWLKLIVQH